VLFLWSLYGTVREISRIADIMYGLSYSEVKVVIFFFLAVLMSGRVTSLFPSVTSLFSVALLVCEVHNMSFNLGLLCFANISMGFTFWAIYSGERRKGN